MSYTRHWSASMRSFGAGIGPIPIRPDEPERAVEVILALRS